MNGGGPSGAMVNESRRRFLKHGAATIVGASLIGNVGSVAANPGVDPLVLKGTRDRPLSVDDIDSRRREYLREHLAGRSDTLDEVVVGRPDIPADEFVAGYGLAFQNGAPVEFVRPVSDPEYSSWTGDRNNIDVEDQETDDPVEAAHNSSDAFASRHSDGSVSTSSRAPGTEPTWDFLGWIQMEIKPRGPLSRGVATKKKNSHVWGNRNESRGLSGATEKRWQGSLDR